MEIVSHEVPNWTRGVGEGTVADYFRVNCLFTSRIQLLAIGTSFNDAQ
jgi:hypothetical protein